MTLYVKHSVAMWGSPFWDDGTLDLILALWILESRAEKCGDGLTKWHLAAMLGAASLGLVTGAVLPKQPPSLLPAERPVQHLAGVPAGLRPFLELQL